jgi:hypothetical protein
MFAVVSVTKQCICAQNWLYISYDENCLPESYHETRWGGNCGLKYKLPKLVKQRWVQPSPTLPQPDFTSTLSTTPMQLIPPNWAKNEKSSRSVGIKRLG